MKSIYLYILVILLIPQSPIKGKEKKLISVKIDQKILYDNNKFNIYLYTKAKDKKSLPKIKSEKFSLSYKMIKNVPDKKINLGDSKDHIWVKVKGDQYKMLIASPTIKGVGKSGVTVSFIYSLNGVDNLKFKDSIDFELK